MHHLEKVILSSNASFNENAISLLKRGPNIELGCCGMGHHGETGTDNYDLKSIPRKNGLTLTIRATNETGGLSSSNL
jgi:hypothetical protein